MSEVEHSRMMLHIASQDLRAVKGMKDGDTFSDEIFGFHAQQAAEKVLKAWLSFIGIDYPKIHDLEELFGLLEDNGEKVPEQFKDLIALTDFAVQFRYELLEETEEPLDRQGLIDNVQALFDSVKSLGVPSSSVTMAMSV